MSLKKKNTPTQSGLPTNKPPKKDSPFRNFFGKLLRFIRTLIIILIIGFCILFLIPRLLNILVQSPKIYENIEDVPTSRVAIVFGAGLKSDGTVTRILRDRVNAAIQLYEAGKVEKILFSGDNRVVEYNEPAAMYQHAIEQGIPAEDLVLDYAGRRTYDTCYRANEIFQVEDAILVTQRFHLPRALFLCNNMGVKSTGYSADLSYYFKSSRVIWNIREIPATFVAIFDAWFRKPIPVLGDPLPIFPKE
jgi:SanA protein